MLPLGKYSFGMGDRFAHQARAQLRACIKAAEQGVEVIPGRAGRERARDLFDLRTNVTRLRGWLTAVDASRVSA